MAVDRSFHHRPPEARRAEGREARKALPRSIHGRWTPAADRPDPIALLKGQDAGRQADLVPIRWGRMSASPFAFYRGSAGKGVPGVGLGLAIAHEFALAHRGRLEIVERARGAHFRASLPLRRQAA